MKCTEINEHWKPFSSKCAYCDIQYDVIGQLDTFQEDMKYVISKNHLENILPIEADNYSKPSSMLRTKSLTLEYFSQLDESQKDQIYRMYKLDFELFNFDASMYLGNKNRNK